MNEPGRSHGRRAAAGIAILLAAATARADRVDLRNGVRIEGRITADTPDMVEVELEGVPVRIRRSSVVGIVKTPPSPEEEGEGKRPRAERGESRRTPREFEGTDLQISRLDVLRKRALESARVLREEPARIRAAEGRLAAEQAKYEEARVRMQAARGANREYNAAVQLANERGGAVSRASQTVTQMNARLEQARQAILAYQAGVDRFRRDYQERKDRFAREQPGHPAWAGYFPRIEERLAVHVAAGSNVHRIPCRFNGPHAMVRVRINGAHTEEWMVDTGATSCSMGAGRADRLQLPEIGKTVVTLAGGQKQTASLRLIRTVELGACVVEGVVCTALPEKPGEEIPGLLGMTFLEHFEISLDPAKRELSLCPKTVFSQPPGVP